MPTTYGVGVIDATIENIGASAFARGLVEYVLGFSVVAGRDAAQAPGCVVLADGAACRDLGIGLDVVNLRPGQQETDQWTCISVSEDGGILRLDDFASAPGLPRPGPH